MLDGYGASFGSCSITYYVTSAIAITLLYVFVDTLTVVWMIGTLCALLIFPKANRFFFSSANIHQTKIEKSKNKLQVFFYKYI